ncbi:MAG: cation transporter [Ruminococcaceae bacterium]|nr:cation transporter [Oscillospiraceae bacterium]
MKTQKNILIAFLLNFLFSVFEFIGGIITGSVAIISDSVHDIGDAFSIGISYFLEKKSKKQPDKTFTYGYLRYSVIASFITTVILMFGSLMVIYNAILRIFNPVTINYNGMIIFAVVGVVVNFIAAYFTKDGDSLNQKAVNLHMLEDVLGWIVVLVGAIIMQFTDIAIIDPVMSICVSVYIFINAIKTLKQIVDLFLEKIPSNVNIDEIKDEVLKIDEIIDVHHIHIWSIDGFNNYATMHIVTDEDAMKIKTEVRDVLKHHHIGHVTLELEKSDENCVSKDCIVHSHEHCHHHHHHH